jgi:hypothetical protein
MDSSVVLICEKKFPEQSWAGPWVKKYVMLCSGPVVYISLIYADLNIRRFENFLVISFVFPKEPFSAYFN